MAHAGYGLEYGPRTQIAQARRRIVEWRKQKESQNEKASDSTPAITMH